MSLKSTQESLWIWMDISQVSLLDPKMKFMKGRKEGGSHRCPSSTLNPHLSFPIFGFL